MCLFYHNTGFSVWCLIVFTAVYLLYIVTVFIIWGFFLSLISVLLCCQCVMILVLLLISMLWLILLQLCFPCFPVSVIFFCHCYSWYRLMSFLSILWQFILFSEFFCSYLPVSPSCQWVFILLLSLLYTNLAVVLIFWLLHLIVLVFMMSICSDFYFASGLFVLTCSSVTLIPMFTCFRIFLSSLLVHNYTAVVALSVGTSIDVFWYIQYVVSVLFLLSVYSYVSGILDLSTVTYLSIFFHIFLVLVCCPFSYLDDFHVNNILVVYFSLCPMISYF